MGTASLNTALNALVASSLAAQGVATGSSSVVTGQSENQPEIVDGRVGAAGAHHESARALQLRAGKFAQPEQPVEEGDFTHIGGNAMLSGAMMLTEAESDGFLGFGLSFEERVMRFAFTLGLVFLMFAIPAVIKFAKVRSLTAKLKSELSEIDWISEHAGEVASHIFRDSGRIEHLHIKRALEAVTSMPIPSSEKWGLFKKIYIERCESAASPFFPWASAQEHAQILVGISEAIYESGYSPEEVLGITANLLANEDLRHNHNIESFVGRDMSEALKTLKDEEYSADEAISALERQIKARN